MIEDMEIQLKSALQRDPRILLAVLFGSFAAGTQKATSDIDLAIAGERPFTADEKVEIALTLGSALNREMDILDLHSAGGVILHQALTTGKQLMNRDPDLYASFLKKLWYDQADLAPLRERLLKERRKKALGT